MIKDILNANENITAGTTAVNKLKAVLPQCFDKDGNLYFDKLKELLRDKVSFADENYGLNFLGKSYGRLLQAMETDTVITPDEEHNKQPQNADSENIYITGDNIDALKHLLKSYENKIKCIYIDPPYNTGSDGFVYNDRFTFTKETLAQKLSMSEETAERILELTNSGSASHSAWLTFMYPRLLLARDLLTDDGVIFISIDDNEQANLKLLCDDVFGEQNFVDCITWNTRVPKNDNIGIGNIHQYILVYVKSKSHNRQFLVRKESLNEVYEFIDKLKRKSLSISEAEERLKNFYDKKGYDRGITLYNLLDENFEPWGKINMSWPNSDTFGEMYDVKHPITKKVTKKPDRGWRWSKDTFDSHVDYDNVIKLHDGSYVCGDIWFASDENTQPSSIKYLKDVENMLLRSIISLKSDGGKDLEELFGGKSYFSNPKPVNLIKLLISSMAEPDNIILDFFGGSATTAHAVMQLNAEDGGNRKFILVQLQEATKEGSKAQQAGYETIDQIGRERIKRAAAKIKEEHPDITADLGFKHFKLNQLNNTQLSQIETFSPVLNLVGSDDLLQNFGTPTVLTTWLNRDGYGLNPSVKVENLANYTAYICGANIYLLENDFDNQALMELCRRYEEDNDFAKITNIIVFGYSFSYTELQALQDNIKKFSVTRNSRINVEIRY